jgi:sigma-E factor negative regulatory protein RseC
MSERITHEGIVDHIDGDAVYVRILSKSACAECHSKGMCGVSEMTEKLIEVKQNISGFTQGQVVNVILDRSLGNKAVLLGYFIPFLILVITLLISSLYLSELWSGLLAIAVLIPYYLLLFFFKDKLSKTFYFRIERL